MTGFWSTTHTTQYQTLAKWHAEMVGAIQTAWSVDLITNKNAMKIAINVLGVSIAC